MSLGQDTRSSLLKLPDGKVPPGRVGPSSVVTGSRRSSAIQAVHPVTHDQLVFHSVHILITATTITNGQAWASVDTFLSTDQDGSSSVTLDPYYSACSTRVVERHTRPTVSLQDVSTWFITMAVLPSGGPSSQISDGTSTTSSPYITIIVRTHGTSTFTLDVSVFSM